MPIQPILCLYFNGLLTTVDLLQKQSVLRWSHVRCSMAQWWLRTIVITEKTASHRPTSGPAALIRDHLSMNITFFSPWFLQGCTNRQESRAILKKSDGAATAQRDARSIVFHGGVMVYVSSLPWTHMAWEILGLWCLSQQKLCDCFGCCWLVSAIAHSLFDPACYWVFLNTSCIKVWSSCLPLGADTYSSTSIIFVIIVVIILFITPLRYDLLMENKSCCSNRL